MAESLTTIQFFGFLVKIPIAKSLTAIQFFFIFWSFMPLHLLVCLVPPACCVAFFFFASLRCFLSLHLLYSLSPIISLMSYSFLLHVLNSHPQCIDLFDYLCLLHVFLNVREIKNILSNWDAYTKVFFSLSFMLFCIFFV